MPIITHVPSNAVPSNMPQGATATAVPSARDRAIAMLSAPPASQSPQQGVPPVNANSVSPEELGALKATSETPEDGQKDINETPTQDLADTKSKEEPLSSQYALLARKEKALRAQVQAKESAIKAREEAIAIREAALTAKDSEYQSNYIPKSRLTEDTLGALAEAGIDYDKLTQLALNPPAQQDPATRAYIAKLEARLNEIDGTVKKQAQNAQEAQSAQYKQAITQIEKDAARLVSVGDDYEAIRSTNSVKDVVELIEKTFKEDQVLLTTEEACKLVEDHLIEESFKLSQLKKIQKRLQEAQKAPAVSPQPSGQQNKQPQMKTLTNAVGSQSQLTTRQRAIAIFKGEKI